MSKAVINNEIIILRKFVEQARVHTIKKLTRDATKYKNKKGTDAQKAKNERKSKRLAAEILSIKKVKKDEITKHILTNDLNLKEVLENQISTPLNRAMARIAYHKIFSKKIAEFKSKYPNYMEFMGPSRKKKAICEWKEKKKIKTKERVEKIVETKEDDEELEISHSGDYEDKLKSIRETSESSMNNKDNNEEGNANKDLIKRKIKRIDEKRNKSSTVRMEKLEKLVETDLQSNSRAMLDERKKDDNKRDQCYLKQNNLKRNNVPKIISKQAIVKKLTDILQEDTSSKDCEKEINSECTNSNIVVKKEVDSFFMTDDDRSYLSIVVPKDKASIVEDDFNDNEERNYKKKKISRQENDKFFSKVGKFKKNVAKVMPQWEDKKLSKKQNNANRCELEKKRNFESTGSRSNGEVAKFVKNEDTTALNYKSVEHLHPSWEAKKKEQEMLKKGFQGKKIIFGDDM